MIPLSSGQSISKGHQARTESVKSANIQSNAGCEENLFVTIKAKGADVQVLQKPDGRKCNTCVHTDDMWDPFTLRVHGCKVYCWWGKPCNEQGQSTCWHCGYCTKFVLSVIKPTMHITFAEYESMLGQNGGARLKVHITKIEHKMKN